MVSEAPRIVALLVGREQSFPEALIAEVARRKVPVEVRYAEVEATRADAPPPYAVVVDRISHEVTCYQPWLKLCALNGTKVINNPFWRIADDKFFEVGLARRLGVAVPKTVLLPSKDYGADTDAGSLRNLRWVDWGALESELGFPMFLKPHWGGGWNDVTQVDSHEALICAFDASGRKTMILQEAIPWTQYVRCLVIGDAVRVALWDPRLWHHLRYMDAPKSMLPLSKELEAKVVADARTLCRALGYQMNTVEFGIRDGVPYAIDFMNSAPDLDVSSLGHAESGGHFEWVVEKMADLVIAEAMSASSQPEPRWTALLPPAARVQSA